MRKDFGAVPVLYPLPVFIVAAYDAEGAPNAMNVAWCGMCSGRPPHLTLGIEPNRKTLENIRARGAFTVSIATAERMAEADFFGISSGRGFDKIAAACCHVRPAAHVDAPVIEEFPMTVECALADTVEVGNCCLVIGRIVNVSVEEAYLDGQGKIDVQKLNPISFDILHSQYLSTGPAVGKAYAEGKKFQTAPQTPGGADS